MMWILFITGFGDVFEWLEAKLNRPVAPWIEPVAIETTVAHHLKIMHMLCL
jgi:hypothetical protein